MFRTGTQKSHIKQHIYNVSPYDVLFLFTLMVDKIKPLCYIVGIRSITEMKSDLFSYNLIIDEAILI